MHVLVLIEPHVNASLLPNVWNEWMNEWRANLLRREPVARYVWIISRFDMNGNENNTPLPLSIRSQLHKNRLQIFRWCFRLAITRPPNRGVCLFFSQEDSSRAGALQFVDYFLHLKVRLRSFVHRKLFKTITVGRQFICSNNNYIDFFSPTF